MNLKRMNRTELDQHLKNLVHKEREILHIIIQTIREIDSRRLYLEMGYGSLFDYLTQGIGYSNASAQRRIDAARLLREIPQLANKIQTGELKLNQISMVQKAAREVTKTKNLKVTTEEKATLLETISNQTVQQTQKEIASFFDLPVEQYTTQKVQADDSVRIELTLTKADYEKLQRAQDLISSAVPEKDIVRFINYVSEKIIQQRTVAASTSRRTPSKTSQYSKEQFNSASEVSKSLTGTLKRNAINKKTNTSTKTTTIADGSKTIEVVSSPQNQNQQSQQLIRAKRKSTTSNATTQINKTELELLSPINTKKETRTRTAIPAKTFALPMWKRGAHLKENCCQYKDPLTGKVCGSTRFLEVDHRQPRWASGSNESHNLQILCAGHNKLKYRLEAGLS